MKNLLPLLAMLLLGISASSQIYVPAKPTIYGEQTLRAKPLIVQHIPFTNNPDDTSLNTTDTTPQIKVIGGVLKYHSGKWRTVGEGVAGANGGFTTEGATNIYITQPGTGIKLAYQVNDSTFGMRTIDFGNGFIIDTTDYTSIRIGYQGSITGGGGGVLDTLADRDPNLVFASPDGTHGSPTFRRLVEDDLPFISETRILNLVDDLASKVDTTSTVTVNGNTQLVKNNPVFNIDTSKTDTSSLSLRINQKLSAIDTTGKWIPIGTVFPTTDTTSLSMRIDTKLNARDTTNKWIPIGTVFPNSIDTTSLSARIDDKLPKSTHIPKDITLTTVGQQGASTLDTATGILNIPNYFFAVTTDSSSIDYSFTSMTTIYNEKAFGEYFPTGHGVFVNPDNTIHVFKQVKSLDVGGWNAGDYISFKNSATATATAYAFLRGFLYLKQIVPTIQSMSLEFYNNGVSVSKLVSVVNYGINKNFVGGYQNFTIPMSAFNFSSNSFDEIRLIFGGGSSPDGLYLDLFQFQNATEKENTYISDVSRTPGTTQVLKTINGQQVLAFNDSIGSPTDTTSLSLRIDQKLNAIDTTHKWLPITTIIPPGTDTTYLRRDIFSLFNRNLTINGVTQNLTQDRTWIIPTTDTSSLSSRINLKVDKATTLTINGIAQDLSVNRTWATPTLDKVALAGNTTTQGLKAAQIQIGYPLPTNQVGIFATEDLNGTGVYSAYIGMKSSGTSTGYLRMSPLTTTQSYYLPNKSGTIALTTDIPSTSTPNLQQVTAVGNQANSFIDATFYRVRTTNNLFPASLSVTSNGTNAGGVLNLKDFFTTHNISLKATNNLTGDWDIFLPDKTGTVALIGDIPAPTPNISNNTITINGTAKTLGSNPVFTVPVSPDLSGNTITINGNSQTLGNNPVFNLSPLTQNLQTVTDQGFLTTHSMTSTNNAGHNSTISPDGFGISYDGGGTVSISPGYIYTADNGTLTWMQNDGIGMGAPGTNNTMLQRVPATQFNLLQLPNKSGILATLDDISGGGGGTGGVDISGNTITINGTSQTLGSNPNFTIAGGRFGIEDNTSDVDRNVNMSNNSININNSSNFTFSQNDYLAYIDGSKYGLMLEGEKSGIAIRSDNIHFYSNYADAVDIDPNAHLRFNQYGTGIITGTATYGLAVDASGNIIETALGGGGTQTSPVRFGVEDNSPQEDRTVNFNQHYLNLNNLNTFGFNVSDVNGSVISGIGSSSFSSTIFSGQAQINAQFSGDISLNVASNNEIYFGFYGAGNKQFPATYGLGVTSNGMIVETPLTGGTGGSGGVTPDLQAVTDKGFITTNPVWAHGLSVLDDNGTARGSLGTTSYNGGANWKAVLSLNDGFGNNVIVQADHNSLQLYSGIPEYADNAAASAAGLEVGTLYRTGDILKIVHI